MPDDFDGEAKVRGLNTLVMETKLTVQFNTTVIFWIELSGNEPSRHIHVDRLIASGSRGRVIVSKHGLECKNCAFDSTSRHNISPCHLPHNDIFSIILRKPSIC